MFKSFQLRESEVLALKKARHIALQSLFEEGNRPRGKITAWFDEASKLEVVTGSDIQFLSPRLKQPRVECHCIILYCVYNESWLTISNWLKPKCELEITWHPDTHTTAKMLRAGIHGDSIKLAVYNDEEKHSVLLSVINSDAEGKRPILLNREVLESELIHGNLEVPHEPSHKAKIPRRALH